MKKVWVAKISDRLGKWHDYELSPRFASAQDCIDWINENLQDLEKDLTNIFVKLLNGSTFINGNRQYYICLGGCFIRAYNLAQKRFVDGFDV